MKSPTTTGAPPQGNYQLSLYTDGWNAGIVALLHVLQGHMLLCWQG